MNENSVIFVKLFDWSINNWYIKIGHFPFLKTTAIYMDGKTKSGNGLRLVGRMRMCAWLADERRELLCGF